MAKRGRPTRPPSEAEREKVKELSAVGSPIADIAKLVKRSIPNLRKYFPRELDYGKKKPQAGFEPTAVQREKVIRYIGCKMKPEDVARAIGCTVEQLRAGFADELATGAAKARASVIDHLHDQMAEGLVGATNRLEVLTAGSDSDGAATRAPAQVGKKIAARLAAEQAVTGATNPFAPRPPPKLIVNNAK